jgi:hypothetical protein
VRTLRPLAPILVALVLLLVVPAASAWGGVLLDICPEPNEAAGSACELRVDRKVTGEIESSSDGDRYRLTVEEGHSVVVTLSARTGNHKLRLEALDGVPVAEVGRGAGVRRVVAERLPAGEYLAYVAGDDVDVRTQRSYELFWASEGRGAPVGLQGGGRVLRDLALSALDAGEGALQIEGRLMAGERGRVYLATYQRENVQPSFKLGPLFLLNRVFVGETADDARAVFVEWHKFDLPDAEGIARPYTSLGDQPMPPVGDEAHALGACFKCDEENPLRHYRLVIRSDRVVWLLYTWGRDSGSNFNVVMSLVDKLVAKL